MLRVMNISLSRSWSLMVIRYDTLEKGVSHRNYVCRPISRAVSEIFSIKLWRDREMWYIQGHSALKWRRSIDHIWLSNSLVPFSSYLTLNDIVTLKSKLGSLIVIGNGTIRKLKYCFLFACCSNYGHIFIRLWDIQRQRMAWPWKLG